MLSSRTQAQIVLRLFLFVKHPVFINTRVMVDAPHTSHRTLTPHRENG